MGTRYINTKASDWTCPDPKCGNLNFARREACNRCGIVKPYEKPIKKIGKEIGKSLAEKSKGLFSAEDWQCSQCGNVNWARRNTCNICNSSKFGKIEERTGVGGGYNERENIEYIEREESDGEYDEFGRKKKKYRGKLNSHDDEEGVTNEENVELQLPITDIPVKDNVLNVKPSEFNDKNASDIDEEDDEVEDLSKYQLDTSDKESIAKASSKASGTESSTESENEDEMTSTDDESDTTESTSSESQASSSGSESDTEPENENRIESEISSGMGGGPQRKKKVKVTSFTKDRNSRFNLSDHDLSDNHSPIPLPPPSPSSHNTVKGSPTKTNQKS